MDKQKQAKNVLIYMIPSLISTILPLITFPIFTRILTKEDYGALALAQVYAVFVCGLTNFGMMTAYERNYFQYRSNAKKSSQLLFSTLAFIMFNSFCLGFFTYIFKSKISIFLMHSALFGNFILINLCANFFMRLKEFYLMYFRNSENAKSYSSYIFIESSINLLLSLYFVAYLRIGIIGLVYSSLISAGIIFLILSYRFIRNLSLSFSMSVLKESLIIAFPLTPKAFFGVIRNQFDKYMLGFLSSMGMVGIYSIGQRIAALIFTFMTSLDQVFIPQMYKIMFNHKKEDGESIGRYLTPFAYVSIFIALLISLFSEEVVSVLAPVSYHGAIDIVIIMSMYYGILFFGKVSGTQLVFMKKTHISTLLVLSNVILAIILNIFFILRWGASGAAWAMFLTELAVGVASFKIAQHYYKISFERSKIGFIFLIFLISSIITIVLRKVSVGYLPRLIVKIIILTIYFYFGVVIKVISRKNYLLFKDVILRRKTVPVSLN